MKTFVGDGNYYERNYEGDTGWFNRNHDLHRLDGPAVEYNHGRASYYIDGELILSKKTWEEDPRVKKALLKKKIQNILDKIS